MPNYISESMSTSEVFRQFGDQVPEFMQTWLDKLVAKVEAAENIDSIIYMNSDIDSDSPEFEKEFTELVEQASKVDGLKEEIENLETVVADQKDGIADLKQEAQDLEQHNNYLKTILEANNITY